jgi:hypothetical protein
LRVRNTGVSAAYKALIAVTGLYGLLLVFGIFDGRCDVSMLRFFTVLSNLLCVLYFTADIIFIIRTRNTDVPPVWFPALKGITTMAITVTLLVAHFVLGMRFTMAGSLSMTLVITHYVVPLLTIADWLLFDPKGLMTFRAPLLWAVGPIAYFVYAMIAARIGGGIGYGGSRYPYPFMDADKIGWWNVLLTVLVLTAFFIALGYVWVLVDKALAKAAARKKEVRKA